MFMLGFPLLLVPFAIYNIIAFLMPGSFKKETHNTLMRFKTFAEGG